MENRKRVLTAVLLGVIMLLVLAAAVGIPLLARQSEKAPTPLTAYWSADSVPARELRDYVAKVTNPADKENFIPEKDRIAVFDMDGTLTCETFYTYYDTMRSPPPSNRAIRPMRIWHGTLPRPTRA